MIMKIEIKVTDFSELTKENVLDKLDEPVKEYLKKSKYKRFKGAITEINLSEIMNSKNMTDDEFKTLMEYIPDYYLSIEPGEDASWINNLSYMELISKFEIVYVNTMKIVSPLIDTLISNIKTCLFETPHNRVSNEFDYSHITMCRDYEKLVMNNLLAI